MGILGQGSRNPPSAGRISRPATADPMNHDSRFNSSASLTKMSQNATRSDHVRDTTSGQSHGFSLSRWTRRIFHTSSHKGLVDVPVSEDGVLSRSPSNFPVFRNRDKELPPDPPRNSGAPPYSNDDLKTPVSFNHRSQNSNRRPHTRPSTATQTTQHHLDNHSPIRVDPSLASLASLAPPSIPFLHPSKSSCSLRSMDPSKVAMKGHDVSRSRVASIALAPEKGKSEKTLLDVGSNKPLARKASGWLRKATDPAQFSAGLLKPPPPPASQSTLLVQADLRTSGLGRRTSFRLKRHNSDRALRHTPPNQRDMPAVPCHLSPQSKSVPRLSTADPSPNSPSKRRPATADSTVRSRAKSLFSSSQTSSTSKTLFTLQLDKPASQSNPSNSPKGKVRPRSITNPPLLHRISVGLFSSAPSPPVRTLRVSVNGTSSPSSRPSASQIAVEALKPQDGESSKGFVQRLASLVSRADIAAILASRYEQYRHC